MSELSWLGTLDIEMEPGRVRGLVSSVLGIAGLIKMIFVAPVVELHLLQISAVKFGREGQIVALHRPLVFCRDVSEGGRHIIDPRPFGGFGRVRCGRFRERRNIVGLHARVWGGGMCNNAKRKTAGGFQWCMPADQRTQR